MQRMRLHGAVEWGILLWGGHDAVIVIIELLTSFVSNPDAM